MNLTKKEIKQLARQNFTAHMISQDRMSELQLDFTDGYWALFPDTDDDDVPPIAEGKVSRKGIARLKGVMEMQCLVASGGLLQ